MARTAKKAKAAAKATAAKNATDATTPTIERPVRGRPAHSAEQVAETRAHIASCALALFHAEGYAAISMRRLATEAGCTPMTLYKYFADKFAILRVLWASVFGELFDRLDRIAAAERDPRARLHAVAEAYVAFWLEHRDHYFLVFMSGGITQEDVSLFMGDLSMMARFDLFRACLADALGVEEAESVPLKSEVLVCGLNGISQGLVTMSGYPWAAPKALVATLVAGLLGR